MIVGIKEIIKPFLTARPFFTGCVCAGVIFAAVLFFRDNDRGGEPGNSFGNIYVDSPEIYTRERLVNDRFREDTWLKSTLESIKRLSAAKLLFQGTVRSSNTEKVSLGVSAQTPSPGDNDAGSLLPGEPNGLHKPDAGESTQFRASASPHGQLRDDFRQLLDIRDSIRKEIIENQLDDRHDIDVNTLYLFKFDVTTIVAANDTSARANIRITITKPDSETLVDSLRTLYFEWVSHLETVLNKGFQARLLAFNAPRAKIGCTDYRLQLLDYVYRDADLLSDVDLAQAREAIAKLEHNLAVGEPDDIDRRLNHIIGVLMHQGNIAKDSSRDEALNWLVAKWVVFDMVKRPGLDRFVAAEIKRLSVQNLRIAVKRIEKDSPIQKGFEFQPQQVEDMDKREYGLEKFLQTFLDNEYRIFTYAVSPKQSVERVADAATYGRSSELLSTLLGSNEPVKIKAALKLLREQTVDVSAIKRNAVIVGFADRYQDPAKNPEAAFGWLIGPRFQIDDSGSGYQYRHVSTQNALSALVSLPSAWPHVKIIVETSWLKEDDTEHNPKSYSYHVSLPVDVDNMTDAVCTRGYGKVGSKPLVFLTEMDDIQLKAGEPAQILIPGRNLWRSTVVTIGSQPSNHITVLPNMEGIIAHFGKIDVASLEDKAVAEAMKLRVWTSEGMASIPGKVSLVKQKE